MSFYASTTLLVCYSYNMPLKYESRCNVCRLAKHDQQLKRRIIHSTYYGISNLEPLTAIQKDYSGAFVYETLRRHVNKHWVLTDEEKIKYKKRTQGELVKKLPATETQLPQITPYVNEDEVFDAVIKQGLEKLQSGEMELSATNVIKAAESKANLNLKRKDQQLKIQEMIWHFASGQAEGNMSYDRRLIEGEEATAYDPTAITAGNAEQGEVRPSAVHQSDAWDATAQRTGEVPTPYPNGTAETAGPTRPKIYIDPS